MKKFRYDPVEHVLSHEELGCHKTFGIRAYSFSGALWIDSGFVPDVSTDAALVARLADRCTTYQLDPCHLQDVVLDAISS